MLKLSGYKAIILLLEVVNSLKKDFKTQIVYYTDATVGDQELEQQ